MDKIKKIWEKTSETRQEAAICVAAGVAAWLLALLAGANESIATYFGLFVFGGLVAVALWVWAKTNKDKGHAVGVDFGTIVIAVCGAGALLGAFFVSGWLVRYSFFGLLGGLAITFVSAIPRRSARQEPLE
ncbi:MAG: hypothetical protein WC348_04035 [Patescibacteria group bacterium]|jgi:hypothetical protein